eukprot:TRINITY_DN13619_c0_g2_i1.p1 TRINITY_DN13619_c0_g2~~TRINITY_DN13619_c0_g2_i1.p1  ORF type:complete len:138 (-),score=10.14 TRINITY_DN13619_c0_g2_i1:39-452(-)
MTHTSELTDILTLTVTPTDMATPRRKRKRRRSTWPLLKGTGFVLLQRTPSSLEKRVPEYLHKVETLGGVVRLKNPHFWSNYGDNLVGTLHVVVNPEINEQIILLQVTQIMAPLGLRDLTVQIEKEQFAGMLQAETLK